MGILSAQKVISRRFRTINISSIYHTIYIKIACILLGHISDADPFPSLQRQIICRFVFVNT